MYSSFQTALLCLARTLAVLDRSRPRRLSAILRTAPGRREDPGGADRLDTMR
jgi:hypothetical protein